MDQGDRRRNVDYVPFLEKYASSIPIENKRRHDGKQQFGKVTLSQVQRHLAKLTADRKVGGYLSLGA